MIGAVSEQAKALLGLVGSGLTTPIHLTVRGSFGHEILHLRLWLFSLGRLSALLDLASIGSRPRSAFD